MLPLAGCLVIAIEQAVAAPFCTRRLADAGARVIKIERSGGETARHYDAVVGGTSAYFAWLNAGKESIVLDLAEPADRALAETMIARADVLVQNLGPGATERLGLGSEQLVQRHPRLIALDIVGYARDSSYGTMKAYDLLVQAEAGLCAVTGTPEAPAKVGVSVADIGTGMNAYSAILEAMVERSLTNRGRALSISMFDSIAEWLSVPVLHQVHTGEAPERCGMAHNLIAPYGAFECRDGHVLIAVQTAAEWARFCRDVLGRAELLEDELFSSNALRVRHSSELDERISAELKSLVTGEVVSRLEKAGLPYGLLRTVGQVAAHPALRRSWVHTKGERFWFPCSPLRDIDAQSTVPELNEQEQSLREEFAA